MTFIIFIKDLVFKNHLVYYFLLKQFLKHCSLVYTILHQPFSTVMLLVFSYMPSLVRNFNIQGRNLFIMILPRITSNLSSEVMHCATVRNTSCVVSTSIGSSSICRARFAKVSRAICLSVDQLQWAQSNRNLKDYKNQIARQFIAENCFQYSSKFLQEKPLQKS